jgi:hypothetical protein
MDNPLEPKKSTDSELGQVARLTAAGARAFGVRIPGGTVRAASVLVDGTKSWVDTVTEASNAKAVQPTGRGK